MLRHLGGPQGRLLSADIPRHLSGPRLGSSLRTGSISGRGDFSQFRFGQDR